jgi:5-amino-6-(5-phosphoribosylamino)uracil reductase
MPLQPIVPSSIRPHTTLILATSLDGKIADFQRSPARFGSKIDKDHLEAEIAKADATLFGAETLRSYGTTLPIRRPVLLQQRQQQGKPPQPVQIVCSASGVFDRQLPFFQQPVPRWLLTTAVGAQPWEKGAEFDQVLVCSAGDRINWHSALSHLKTLGIDRLMVLGGGTLVSALIEARAIDELWITVCPLLLGGNTAPTFLAGAGFTEATAPRLELIELNGVNDEVFLHYRVARQ